ncbi:MAG: accessory factor UbiK family protein [Nevskiales bacterium]
MTQRKPNAQLVEDLAARLGQLIPPGLKDLRAELERNFRALLQSQLSRLELVGREEFEVQQEVLKRTRAKLDKLEKQLAVLERSQQGRDKE